MSVNPKQSKKYIEVETGLLEEEHKFVWTIRNFDMVRKSDAQVLGQKFTFNCGSRIGLPTSWHINLAPFTALDEEKWVGVFFKLQDFPEQLDEINVQRRCMVRKPEGGYFFEGFDAFRNLAEKPIGGWGFGKVIPKSANVKDLPLFNGALEIEITFKLFSNPVAKIGKVITDLVIQFEMKSVEKLSQDLSQIESETEDEAKHVVTLISKDQQKFQVYRKILAARSAVFDRMFKAGMQECNTGEVHIEDFSGETIKALISYVYTGKLPESWNKHEILQELPYAASKYELDLLLEFYDQALGTLCVKNNVKQLAVMALHLQLKTASKELFYYLREHSTCLEDLCLPYC